MNTPHTAPASFVAFSFAPEHIALVTAEGASRQTHQLPLSLSQVVQMFGQRMPNALQLENAIAEVEDAIMPAARLLPAQRHSLSGADPLLLQVIHSATANPPATTVSRDAIETLFSALARQAERPGYADAQIPQTPEFAAALLVLRECMHHWGFAQLQAHP